MMTSPADDVLGTICVLGAGAMGSAFGRAIAATGRQVILTSRDLDRAAAVARTMGAGVSVLAARDALARAGCVVLAVPYPAALRLARGFPAFAEEKVVLDLTNPLTALHDGLVTGPDTCAAVELARAVPYAPLVKAFNTLTPAELRAPRDCGQPVLVAGDEQTSKTAVLRLAEQMGFVAMDAGPLVYARHLEGLVLLNRTVAARNDVTVRMAPAGIEENQTRKAAVG